MYIMLSSNPGALPAGTPPGGRPARPGMAAPDTARVRLGSAGMPAPAARAGPFHGTAVTAPERTWPRLLTALLSREDLTAGCQPKVGQKSPVLPVILQ